MKERTRLSIAGIALLGTIPAAYIARPIILDGAVSPCVFKAITGRPGIFCGLTRAFAHATHGEFAEAFALHPLWWLAMLFCLVAGLGFLAAATVRFEPGKSRWGSLRLRYRTIVILVVVTSILRAWLYRGVV